MRGILVQDFRHLSAHLCRDALHPGGDQIQRLVTAARKSVFHHDGGYLDAFSGFTAKGRLHIQRLTGDALQLCGAYIPHGAKGAANRRHGFGDFFNIFTDARTVNALNNLGVIATLRRVFTLTRGNQRAAVLALNFGCHQPTTGIQGSRSHAKRRRAAVAYACRRRPAALITGADRVQPGLLRADACQRLPLLVELGGGLADGGFQSALRLGQVARADPGLGQFGTLTLHRLPQAVEFGLQLCGGALR